MKNHRQPRIWRGLLHVPQGRNVSVVQREGAKPSDTFSAQVFLTFETASVRMRFRWNQMEAEVQEEVLWTRTAVAPFSNA